MKGKRMKFTVERNWIDVVGIIWMPSVTCSQTISLSKYDMDNIGEPTRENVEQWLCTHTGDFQSITDFHAVIGDTEIPFATEQCEMAFMDCQPN